MRIHIVDDETSSYLDRLMSLEKQTVHSEAESKETDSLITKWTGLHAIRVGWLAAATVTAYVGLVAL